MDIKKIMPRITKLTGDPGTEAIATGFTKPFATSIDVQIEWTTNYGEKARHFTRFSHSLLKELNDEGRENHLLIKLEKTVNSLKKP